MLTYISKQLNLSYTDFNHYGERRATRFTHIEEICTWYGYKPFTDTESRALEEYIEEKAIASDEPFSLVESGIDFLRNKKNNTSWNNNYRKNSKKSMYKH